MLCRHDMAEVWKANSINRIYIQFDLILKTTILSYTPWGFGISQFHMKFEKHLIKTGKKTTKKLKNRYFYLLVDREAALPYPWSTFSDSMWCAAGLCSLASVVFYYIGVSVSLQLGWTTQCSNLMSQYVFRYKKFAWVCWCKHSARNSCNQIYKSQSINWK